MIVPADAEFHPNDGADPTWAETIGFWFAVPEANTFGNVYVLARPNVGATISAVNVVSGICPQPFAVDHTDPQMHVPCPPSMASFSLTSGLRVEVPDPPTGYRFGYQSHSGACAFDLRLEGVMPAWDPHDPAENPLIEVDPAHVDLGLGDAWSRGHLDFAGRVSGELELRGKRFDVRSMGAMDRSWGPRSELGQTAVSYLHIPFDDRLVIHLVMALDLKAGVGEGTYGPLRFGYVAEMGDVAGIVSAQMSASTIDLLPSSNHIIVTDVRGRRIEVRGSAIAGAPWYSFSPAYVAFQALMRYELGGRVAYGLMSDVWGLETLARRTSRTGARS